LRSLKNEIITFICGKNSNRMKYISIIFVLIISGSIVIGSDIAQNEYHYVTIKIPNTDFRQIYRAYNLQPYNDSFIEVWIRKLDRFESGAEYTYLNRGNIQRIDVEDEGVMDFYVINGDFRRTLKVYRKFYSGQSENIILPKGYYYFSFKLVNRHGGSLDFGNGIRYDESNPLETNTWTTIQPTFF